MSSGPDYNRDVFLVEQPESLGGGWLVQLGPARVGARRYATKELGLAKAFAVSNAEKRPLHIEKTP